ILQKLFPRSLVCRPRSISRSARCNRSPPVDRRAPSSANRLRNRRRSQPRAGSIQPVVPRWLVDEPLCRILVSLCRRTSRIPPTPPVCRRRPPHEQYLPDKPGWPAHPPGSCIQTLHFPSDKNEFRENPGTLPAVGDESQCSHRPHSNNGMGLKFAEPQL